MIKPRSSALTLLALPLLTACAGTLPTTSARPPRVSDDTRPWTASTPLDAPFTASNSGWTGTLFDSRSASPAPQRRTPSGFPYSDGHAGAFWSPVVVLDLNEKKHDPATPSADIESASGWGARLGRWEDSLGMDIVYQTSKHDERRTGATVRASSLYVDIGTRGLFWPGQFSGWGSISLGAGLAKIDWNRTYKDDLTGHWQAKARLALQISKWFEMDLSVAAFGLAHPGRTVGQGGLASIGGTIHF